MDFWELILISVGLAMDCFAVSFSAGAAQKEITFKNTFLLAFFFGLFQGLMPLIGWYGGEALTENMSHFDHWIAFFILLIIGGKMLLEGILPNKKQKTINIMKPTTLLFLSIATSIDALAVGFSFSMLKVVNIWFSISLIALFSFLFSILGVYGGKKFCQIIKASYAEIAGGIILIAIGIKILTSHLLA